MAVMEQKAMEVKTAATMKEVKGGRVDDGVEEVVNNLAH